jgi:uncharacterized protein YbbK (DUF523 family)
LLKPKVIISACLLGEYCRYDGKTKRFDELIKAFEGYEIIPFCPEAPLFGTPRQRINVIHKNGENRIIKDESNEDVTQKLQDEIGSFIKQNPHAKTIVLKSKSPSCGIGTTPILDEKKDVIKVGNGIAADLFVKSYKDAEIYSELNYLNKFKTLA